MTNFPSQEQRKAGRPGCVCFPTSSLSPQPSSSIHSQILPRGEEGGLHPSGSGCAALHNELDGDKCFPQPCWGSGGRNVHENQRGGRKGEAEGGGSAAPASSFLLSHSQKSISDPCQAVLLRLHQRLGISSRIIHQGASGSSASK